MEQKRIVIIGAVASGTKSAAKARREDPDVKITLVTDEDEISYASCGTPYFVSDIIKDSNSLIIREPAYFRKMLNVDVLTGHRAESIDSIAKNVEIKNLQSNQSITLDYDRLVLAVGASPNIPSFKGVEHGNILTLHNIPSAIQIKSLIQQKKINNALIVGGGFIALEMAESLISYGINTRLIIRREQILSNFDKDIALLVQNYIKTKGVQVLEEDEVMEFEADKNGNIANVITKKQTLPAEFVLLATSIRPNVQLAMKAGIEIGQTGAIYVNEKLETNIPDIYAVGDCAETMHLITKKPVWTPLATTANKHGRVAGINITGGNDTFPGILGTFVVKVFDWTIAKTGLSENEAIKNGFETETVIVPANDKAHYYPGSKRIIIKLIAEKGSRLLLGAEIVGDGVVDKRVDVIASALTGRATIEQLSKYDLSYAPPYSSPMDPVITAANVLRNKLDGETNSISSIETKEKQDMKDDFILLDVRTKPEYDSGYIEGCLHIPLNELRSKIDQLDKSKEIVTYCGVGLRASHAHRILKKAGFADTKFMEGSMATWPYKIER
jgi:NADPH-dependent 2,4-dienoyl-CoA reductase/sulfur reductase-like enzyme/rhodanese-related sulfurtransferase